MRDWASMLSSGALVTSTLILPLPGRVILLGQSRLEHSFGTASRRRPASTLFPSGEQRNEEQAGAVVSSTLLGPEEAAASRGFFYEYANLAASSRVTSAGRFKIRVLDTARPKGTPDGVPSTLWARPYLENCTVNASI